MKKIAQILIISAISSLMYAQNTNKILSDIEKNMVYVEGGTFWMGCDSATDKDCWDSEFPRHQVTLSGFYISKYEVTQAQWQAVMGENPSYFTNCPDCPVEEVSWDDVQEFIEALNEKTGKEYRLPTEAEWEYAARGGKKSKGYIYSGSNILNKVAWNADCVTGGNSDGQTHPVGQLAPNELGIYDMSGNVWEWCEDKYDKTGSDRVLRGGSWLSYAQNCRVSYRDLNDPGKRFSSFGFRLASSSK